MNILKGLPVLLAALMMPGALPAQEDFGMEAHIGLWRSSPKGDLSYSPAGPTRFLDLEDDLGMDARWEPMFRLKTRLPDLPNLYLRVTPLSFDETGTASEPYPFGGTVFPDGQSVDSELSLNIYDAALFLRTSLVQLGSSVTLSGEAGLDLRILTIKAELSRASIEEDPGAFEVIEESTRENKVFPMIYAGLDLQATERISLETEIWAYAFRGDDIYSIVGRVALEHFEPVLTTLGYRAEIMDFEKDDLELDAAVQGPFIEVGFGF